jgi:hypothetical protein
MYPKFAVTNPAAPTNPARNPDRLLTEMVNAILAPGAAAAVAQIRQKAANREGSMTSNRIGDSSLRRTRGL